MKELKLMGNSIITGENSIYYLEKIKAKKAFIVTGGSSMFKNGTIDKISNILESINCTYEIFSGVEKNPGTDIVLNGVNKMNEFNPEVLIAVGGGSAIDAAKVMSLFYEYKELNFENALVNLPETRHKIELIAIPSTSGTGTEVTKAAVITYKHLNRKVGLKSTAFIPDIAILDPLITLSMPKNVVAETGMDAMTHLVESYINKNLDIYTETIAKSSIEGLFEYLPISYANGDIASRERVHVYQCIAGSVLSNVGLGMAHGISHAFGARYNEGHGLLNAVALPYVLKFNSRDSEVKRRLEELSTNIGMDFIQAIININKTLNIPNCFKELNIPEKDFLEYNDILVDASMLGSTIKNPVKISKEEMKNLLNIIYYNKQQ
ncbi:MAG: iron-containing alcohol dehydrogenase [Clostridiaceae bacterium]